MSPSGMNPPRRAGETGGAGSSWWVLGSGQARTRRVKLGGAGSSQPAAPRRRIQPRFVSLPAAGRAFAQAEIFGLSKSRRAVGTYEKLTTERIANTLVRAAR